MHSSGVSVRLCRPQATVLWRCVQGTGARGPQGPQSKASSLCKEPVTRSEVAVPGLEKLWTCTSPQHKVEACSSLGRDPGVPGQERWLRTEPQQPMHPRLSEGSSCLQVPRRPDPQGPRREAPGREERKGAWRGLGYTITTPG